MPYQDRCLHALPSSCLQPRPARGGWSESGRSSSTRRAVLSASTALATLNDDAEHTVTSTAPFVPIRARRPTITLTTQKHLAYALQAGHDLLTEGREYNIRTGPLYLHRLRDARGRWCKEVMDCLVVNFQIRAAQQIFACRRPPDVCEDIFHGARDDAWLILIAGLRIVSCIEQYVRRIRAHKCERLSTGSLAICKDDSVVTIHCSADMAAGNGIVYRLIL